MKLKIGCDPELFVKRDGKFISGHNLMPGTKSAPHLVRGGAVQVDGVALEFNTFPVSTADEFCEVVQMVRSAMGAIVQDRAEGLGLKGLEIVAVPTAYFEKDYFDALPGEVKLLGCTPDYNAYTGEPNDPPKTDEPFRTGAGHIHIGWTQNQDPLDPEHFQTCRNIVKQLDATLFPLSEVWDKDTKRRTLYGSKGSFRPKGYGVEYRPLSNAFLKSEVLIRRVFNETMRVSTLYFEEGQRKWEKAA